MIEQPTQRNADAHNETAEPTPSFRLLRRNGLRLTAAERQSGWLWHGYLLPGRMTMFTGQWKLGKTTLVALLLSRMRSGGELAGCAVRPAKAIVVTDEIADLWDVRCEQFDIGDHVGFMAQPFRGPPLMED
jgi:hypothetical protein